MTAGERQAGEDPGMVAARQRGVTDRDCSGVLERPNGQGDTVFRDTWFGILSRSWGKIEDDPRRVGVGAPVPGSDLSTAIEFGSEAISMLPEISSLSREEAQRRAIEALDGIRKQGDSYKINKPRWMLIAREVGLSFEEIAVLLGMTEGATRRAILRAKNSPDYIGGV